MNIKTDARIPKGSQLAYTLSHNWDLEISRQVFEWAKSTSYKSKVESNNLQIPIMKWRVL